ncbi:hypothetical protein [Pedobacter mendelii]|uniref:Uncharacterized protein n=1 Tax=Pedobacter mendelii TaxID=1908240 RepID=A0ABQ2BM44_9SPHI|nr:hypothetical protein [Pedobacter mendelii]GGI29494.1 hypothetical protein GCM10008119_37910 [Pedobacter mendelii]
MIFLQIKQQLEKSLGKADNGYQNEFGMAQVWIKNGLKHELSKTFKTDLVKAYMFYSISKTKNQLLYF